MKQNRQQKILEIIADKKIQTQETLLEELEAAGFKATQATISRDIRALKLVKKSGDGGTYYAAPFSEVHFQQISLNASLAQSICRVDAAMNIVVVRTTPGMAQALAFEIDRFEHDSMLGSVAGDDTIIIVTNSAESAASFAGVLRNSSMQL